MTHCSPSSGERPRADPSKDYLPRLSPEHYRGDAFVHWTLTIDQRATGWLTTEFHHAWQITLLHACSRYGLTCPCYTLMPDHMHLLWIGMNIDSDQRQGIAFLRKHLRAALAPHDWQKQAHDHVLREDDREQNAFQSIAHYIFENPVRGEHCATASAYAYAGCCVPGYPELDWRADDYWLRFWRLYNHILAKS